MVPVMTNWPRSIVAAVRAKGIDEPFHHVERVAEHQRAGPFLALHAIDGDGNRVRRKVEIAPMSCKVCPNTAPPLPKKSATICGASSTVSRLNLGLMISMAGMSTSMAASTSSRA